jgi:hypothetical protein
LAARCECNLQIEVNKTDERSFDDHEVSKSNYRSE